MGVSSAEIAFSAEVTLERVRQDCGVSKAGSVPGFMYKFIGTDSPFPAKLEGLRAPVPNQLDMVSRAVLLHNQYAR